MPPDPHDKPSRQRAEDKFGWQAGDVEITHEPDEDDKPDENDGKSIDSRISTNA